MASLPLDTLAYAATRRGLGIRGANWICSTVLGIVSSFQGKALLTTFKEEGILKHNIGLFADTTSENYDAVLTTDNIAPVFRRDEVGTDIFVLGFEKDSDWMEQSAISVIEYFFYSIYKGNLEVTVAEGDKVITINQANLPKLEKLTVSFRENG